MDTKTKITIDSGILTMPEDLRNYAINNMVSASPYNRYGSGSYYSKEGKTWGTTPEGIIRISDHWNFLSQGKLHCRLEQPSTSETATGWVVAVYSSETDTYTPIATYPKDISALRLRESRQQSVTLIEDTIKQQCRERMAKMLAKLERRKIKEAAAARAAAIRAGHIFFKGYAIDYFSRAGGRGKRYFSSQNVTMFGRVNYESPCRTNGRKINCYRELNLAEYMAAKPADTLKAIAAILSLEPAVFDTIKTALQPDLLDEAEMLSSFGAHLSFLNRIAK